MAREKIAQIEMKDYMGVSSKSNIVNISKVPQRSPFRYAGGKTWMVPVVRQWLPIGCEAHLIEPFCGGGIVSLTAASEGRAKRVSMIEKDEDVASVWMTIFNDHEWIIDRIRNFEFTKGNVEEVINMFPKNINERGFQTLVRNRVNYGGILAKGACFIKNGENGKGINSRWYPETLVKRILDITTYKHLMEFFQSDAFDFLNEEHDNNDTYFFIDPPYTIAGKRLYTLSDVDHEEIFRRVVLLKCHYLMTYDKCDYILQMVDKYQLKAKSIPMRTGHLSIKEEILISDSFDWMS